MKLDLDILHAGYINPRLPGKTTRMLVTAAHQADFDARDVTIVAATSEEALRLVPAFLEIAEALGFDPQRLSPRQVRIKQTTYAFVGAAGSDMPPSPAGVTLYDNFAGWDGTVMFYQDDPPFHVWPTRYPSDWLRDEFERLRATLGPDASMSFLCGSWHDEPSPLNDLPG